jgi:hypothetical protein
MQRGDATYCVIGVKAFQRTWVKTAEEAVEHARDLLEQTENRYGHPNDTTELYVVKAVKIVKLAPRRVPIIVEDVP